MTDHDLEQVIFLAIARNRPSKQPAAILTAIEDAGYIVVPIHAWRPGVGDRVHFQDQSGSSGTVIDVGPNSGWVEIAWDDGRTDIWHQRDLHPGDLDH